MSDKLVLCQSWYPGVLDIYRGFQVNSVIRGKYSGPPLMWSPLGNGNSVYIRVVAAGEG